MAQRVYEKARKRLISLITLSGIVLTIIGILGIKSIVDYTKNVVMKKLESISEDQINKLVQEEGKRQVSIIVKQQKTELETVLVATARQQINQIALASSPVGGEEKPSIFLEPIEGTLDLTSSMNPVRDQGGEGSVIGFAVAATLEYQIYKKYQEKVIISPRYLYYHAKLKGGFNPFLDAGAHIRDAVKVIQTKGAVSENTWPYKPMDLKSKPPEGIETARHYKIKQSFQLENLEEIKSALQKYGPVVAGTTIFNSMHDKDAAKTGIIPDPSPDDSSLGGIALCIVGYDDDKKLIKFKNSWGPAWGDNGYGYISYEYAEKFLRDAWAFTM